MLQNEEHDQLVSILLHERRNDDFADTDDFTGEEEFTSVTISYICNILRKRRKRNKEEQLDRSEDRILKVNLATVYILHYILQAEAPLCKSLIEDIRKNKAEVSVASLWNKHKYELPVLHHSARKVLAPLLCSVERLFNSLTAVVSSKNRNRLSDITITNLAKLREYLVKLKLRLQRFFKCQTIFQTMIDAGLFYYEGGWKRRDSLANHAVEAYLLSLSSFFTEHQQSTEETDATAWGEKMERGWQFGLEEKKSSAGAK